MRDEVEREWKQLLKNNKGVCSDCGEALIHGDLTIYCPKCLKVKKWLR